jgi:hypothetical protein
VADVFHRLHPEVWGVEVRHVQPFQVQNGMHPATLLRDEKDEADITARRRQERNVLYGSLKEEGFPFLVDVEIVLALRRVAEVRTRQGKRRGRGEVRVETLHCL